MLGVIWVGRTTRRIGEMLEGNAKRCRGPTPGASSAGETQRVFLRRTARSAAPDGLSETGLSGGCTHDEA